MNNMPTCSAPTQPLTAAPTQPASSSAPPHCGRDVCRRCGRCSVTPQPRMWHPPPRPHPSQPCQLLRSRGLPARHCVAVPPPPSARRLQQCRPSYRRCGRPWPPFEAPYSSSHSSSHSESAVGVVAEVTSVNESHHRLHAHRHHGTSTPQHAPRSTPIHAHGVEWCVCACVVVCVCACLSVPVCMPVCVCGSVVAVAAPDTVCGVCLRGESFSEDPILLCDGCGIGVHLMCYDLDDSALRDDWCVPVGQVCCSTRRLTQLCLSTPRLGLAGAGFAWCVLCAPRRAKHWMQRRHRVHCARMSTASGQWRRVLALGVIGSGGHTSCA